MGFRIGVALQIILSTFDREFQKTGSRGCRSDEMHNDNNSRDKTLKLHLNPLNHTPLELLVSVYDSGVINEDILDIVKVKTLQIRHRGQLKLHLLCMF